MAEPTVIETKENAVGQVRRREAMTAMQIENPELPTHIAEVADHAKSIATLLCNKLSERSPLRNN